jgi:hypothetical protein
MQKITLLFLMFFIMAFKINFAQWESTSGPEAGHITTMCEFQNKIFSGTQYGDVFSSTDNGSSWIETGTVEIAIEEGDALSCIAGNSSTLLAGTLTNIFRSTDSGITWVSSLNNIYVEKIITVNEIMYAATGNGVFHSTDNGLTWQNLTADLPDTNIIAIESLGADLFVSVFDHGVYKSINNGASWNLANTGITSDRIDFLSSDGSKLYAAFSG